MNHFTKDLDLFITDDGRAQNRIPSDLTKIATQQGTVLNETMVNGIVFEIRNAIEGLGETPDRSKENQLITGLKTFLKTEIDSVKEYTKTLSGNNNIYQNIGQIKSWICAKDKIPTSEAVLDGSILNPADYEDNLDALIAKFPDWSSDGQVQLPNYNNYFQRYQISDSRIPGSKQEHSMQKLTPSKPTFTASSIVTIPGKAVLKESRIGTTYSALVGYRSQGVAYYDYSLSHQSDTRKTITMSATGEISLSGATTDSANENRPQNFAVLMSVVVGIRKAVES